MVSEHDAEMKGNAVVLGAGSGIGRMVACTLAVRGVDALMIVDKSQDGLDETAKLLKEASSKCPVHIKLCDVTSEAEVNSFAKAVDRELGRVDYVVNTAGYGATSQTPISDMKLTDFQDLMNVHITGSFLVLRAMLQRMLAQDLREVSCGPGPANKTHRSRGSIVILSSLASEGSFLGVGNYVTAKHGVKGLVQTAGKSSPSILILKRERPLTRQALENARKGIRVNAVAPSYVSGPMMDAFLANSPALKEIMLGDLPLGRLVDPEEVADAVVFLLSGRSSYINGHTLVVDGGASLQLSNQPFTDGS